MTEVERQLYARIRQTYVSERRKFETRLSGVPSSYGLSPMPKWDGTDDVKPGSTRRGTQDKYGKSYKPIWPKIAQVALSAGIDPVELIKARFAFTRGPRPPEPTDCMSSASLELCKKPQISVDALNDQLYQYFTNLKTEAENRSVYISRYNWTPEKVIDSIVRDLTLPFPPIFRHYLSVANGIRDMAEMLRPHAVIEYLRQRRSYDSSSWKEIISQDIINEAALAAA